MTKSTLQTILRLLIGPVLVGWLLYTIGWAQVWAMVQQAQGQFFALAFGCYALTVLLRTWRWQTLVTAQGIPVGVRQLLPLELVGGFFNLILPSSVGGDVVKFYRLGQQYPAAAQPRIAGTLIADRFAGILVLLWLGAVMTPFALGNNPLTLTVILLTLGGTVGVIALLTERGRQGLLKVPGVAWALRHRALKSLYDSLSDYTAPVMVRTLGIALLFNLAMIGCYMALGSAFGLMVAAPAYFVIVPLLSLAQAIPLTPNGLGVREGGAVALLGLFHVSYSGAMALALGYLACLVIAGLVGGLLTLGYSLRPLVTPSRALNPSDGGSSVL